jgi:hypothetical protein
VQRPEGDRLVDETRPAVSLVHVHHGGVVRVREGHPTGEGLPQLREELRGLPVRRGSNDLSIANGEIEVAAAEWTEADLIGPEEVEGELAPKCGSGGRAALFLR